MKGNTLDVFHRGSFCSLLRSTGKASLLSSLTLSRAARNRNAAAEGRELSVELPIRAAPQEEGPQFVGRRPRYLPLHQGHCLYSAKLS